MLVQYYYPFSLSPSRLDRYLSAGWFRNSIMLFRSRLLCMEGDLFNVVNIRLPLQDYTLSKANRKLLRKNKELFTYSINRASINVEKERLYEAHKPRFKGFIYNDLHQFLYSDTISSVFHTYEIEVKDANGKLVALSYFDKGQQSMASLLGIYDPEYSKYSLGTFTMLLEMEYALKMDFKFYYPGYIFDKPSVFDYKLRLGNYEYYDWRGKWKPYTDFKQVESFSGHLKAKVNQLKSELNQSGIKFSEKIYPLFPLGYMDKTIDPFVKSPMFLQIDNSPFYKKEVLFEYNADEDKYSVCLVSKCPEYNHLLKMQRNYILQSGAENISVLKYVKCISSSESPDVLIKRYLEWVR
jgi:arginyl-tRNA--protein-N-Asp/Glu arginylyltransferase